MTGMTLKIITQATLTTLALCCFAPVANAGNDIDVSGRVFVELTDQTRTVNGTPAAYDHRYGIELKRFYVTVTDKISDTSSLNLTTDTVYSSRTGQADLFVKKAYFEHKYSKALTVRVGAADMPWAGYVDGISGTRAVEKNMTDRMKWAPTSDWGVHTLGHLTPNISYGVSVVTGSGYREATLTKSLDVEGRISAKYGPIQFSIGGYSGKLGQDVKSASTPQTAQRFDALLAYTGANFRIGIDYAKGHDFSAARVKSSVSDDMEGVSVFSSYRVNPKLVLFGRYERTSPSQDLSPIKRNNLDFVGAAYAVKKDVEVALVSKNLYTKTATTRTSDRTVGLYLYYKY